jgi:hypothetical protein
MFHFIFLILITNSISLYISKCEKLIAKANEINKNSALQIQSGILNQQDIALTPEPTSRKLSGYTQVSDKCLQKIKGRLRDCNKINFVKK